MPRTYLICVLFAACFSSPLYAQKEFGFVNTKPSGQPYLPPEESLRRMHVPPGYEVKLFAAEPDIINPIAFTVDERGRLWVVECYEYPKRTPKGKKPRDRIKILEDATRSGKADRVSVWVEGKDLPTFDLASGIEVGHGGVFLGAAPYLFFLQDKSGRGQCDSQEVRLQGFGSQDTHEVLNTLQWGPDGRLYGLEGIFTQSQVGGVRLDAAVWRYEVEPRKFDIFAEGTSNPWGFDFDQYGQAFLTACVIPHAFHMVPGGTYIRQAGSGLNPYAYGLLHEISDHLHHAESGWAHAGALVLQGNHVPLEFQDSLLMGSIHGFSIKRDVLGRNGSTYVARHAPDFLTSGDKNFRPVNMRWGPEGSIYVIDWHDQNPCHQALPDSWDMTHGRIYKIQRKGTTSRPTDDMSKKTSRELVKMLRDDNPWAYRTALRLLGERRDQMVTPLLEAMLQPGNEERHALRALWALNAIGALDERIAGKTLHHDSRWLRAWTIRLLGGSGQVAPAMMREWIQLAKNDPSPEVRLQLACSCRRLSGPDAVVLLEALMRRSEDGGDPCIPLMIWWAYEPHLAAREASVFPWLAQHAEDSPLLAFEIVPRALRRLCSSGKLEDLEDCSNLLTHITESAARRRALESLLQALENREVESAARWSRALSDYLRDKSTDVVRLARRVAAKFRDREALRLCLAMALDRTRPLSERIDAVHDLAAPHPPEALAPLQELLVQVHDADLCGEVCRTLSAYDDPALARRVLAGWRTYPQIARPDVINLLASRKAWSRELLAAVSRKDVSRSDLNNNAILRMRALHDQELNAQIESLWGRVRETTPAELSALIEQKRQELEAGRSSFEAGRKVFDNHCTKCHRFEGRGYEVGPGLDGAGRDIDYLLVNILDPNRVIGKPYLAHFVMLKDGRVETGILVAEDSQSITLKGENAAVKLLQRKNIEEILVEGKSLMPEGLSKNMSVQDFRDLIRYLMANPFLTDVALAGPMQQGQVVTVDARNPQSTQGVTWGRPMVGPAGKIVLPRPIAGGEATAYISASVQAPAAMQTRLMLGCGSQVQVWLNGQSILQAKPGDGDAVPDQMGVDVNLRPGTNQLLFRITYRGAKEALYVRLLDPQRQLR